MAKEITKAHILGAGPFGLVVAESLAKRGVEVVLYEKLDQVGGMCRTWKWDNFLLDTGPHIFHTPDANLAKYWEENFSDLFVKGEFRCKNIQGDNFDKVWDYPVSWESISKYPNHIKKKILNELDHIDEGAKSRANSYQEFVDAQVGKTLGSMFFKEYPEKVWGISTETMSAQWAPKRIELRQKNLPFYHGQWNAVGKYGTGCVLERIEENIINLGGVINLGRTITGIGVEKDQVSSLKFLGHPDVRVKENEIVISSLPITLLGRFLGHKSSLKFRGICSVYISTKLETILPDNVHWQYYGSKKVLFNRITEPKKMSPFVSNTNSSYLTIETTYSKNDEFDSLSDNEILSVISSQVESTGLINRKNIDNICLNKEDFVYPVQHIGHQDSLSLLRSKISKYHQLYTMGTGGEFFYSDIQVLFHKAFDLVDNLFKGDRPGTEIKKRVERCKPNKNLKIGDTFIGDGFPAYIIAEAGLNHNGSKDLAFRLVNAAVESGCNAVKFQTYLPNSRVSSKIKGALYAEQSVGQEEGMDQMFSRLSMSFSDQREVFDYARNRGLEVFSTPFDIESVDFLESFGVNIYKIASMDLVNLPLIKCVAKTMKPVLISTGMSTLGQIEEAVNTVLDCGNPNLMLLHCNSSYPATPEEMNLKAIETLKRCFNLPVGLSDHTFGLFVSQTALALGANIIERHFTLDRTMEGPDHILSSEPEEFTKLVQFSKLIPKMLGDGVKRVQPNEFATMDIQRKCLYAKNDIEAGTAISEDMLTVKGPGGGLLPKYKDIIIGRKAKQTIFSDYPITWESV